MYFGRRSLITGVAFGESDLVGVVLQEEWPDKRVHLWWEGSYKRNDLSWEWPDKRVHLWWEGSYKRNDLSWEWPDKRVHLWWGGVLQEE